MNMTNFSKATLTYQKFVLLVTFLTNITFFISEDCWIKVTFLFNDLIFDFNKAAFLSLNFFNHIEGLFTKRTLIDSVAPLLDTVETIDMSTVNESISTYMIKAYITLDHRILPDLLRNLLI